MRANDKDKKFGREPHFAIFDRSKRSLNPYVQKTWESEKEARWELANLLRPYPQNHEWRQRLCVKETFQRYEQVRHYDDGPEEFISLEDVEEENDG